MRIKAIGLALALALATPVAAQTTGIVYGWTEQSFVSIDQATTFIGTLGDAADSAKVVPVTQLVCTSKHKPLCESNTLYAVIYKVPVAETE